MGKRYGLILMAILFGALVLQWGCSPSKSYQLYGGDERNAEEIARLSVPKFIEIWAVDGRRIESWFVSHFDRREQELELLPGRHTVALRYNDLWPLDQYEHERILSPVVELSFEVEAGKRYGIDTEEPMDLERAKAYAANFKAKVIELAPE